MKESFLSLPESARIHVAVHNSSIHLSIHLTVRGIITRTSAVLTDVGPALTTPDALSHPQNDASRSLAGLWQKVSDYIDYIANRSVMLLRIHLQRLRHRFVFGRRVDRILVIRLGSIGDVIRATAVVGALRERYPDAQIDLLTSPQTRSLVERHPGLDFTHDVDTLERLGQYDWVVNLQNRYPVESFLRPGVGYQDVLAHVSNRLGARMISGRHIRNGREVSPTNILYCRSEMEELFLIALLDFDPAQYPHTAVTLDEATSAAARDKFALPNRPILGLFIGSNSVGCGADNGFRTYSMDYLARLIGHFSERFAIAVIGQSSVRTVDERRQYEEILRLYPSVVDLVDKTTLPELASIMNRFAVLITTDSSPVHLALARGVPVVALYVMDGSFRLGPQLEYRTAIGINSAPPCFYYSWRWRFFCGPCRDSRTRAAYCYQDTYAFSVDRIPLERIDEAVGKLLRTEERVGVDR